MKRLNHFTQGGNKAKRFVAVVFAITLLAAFPFSESFSNNINIPTGTVSYDQAAGTVTFNLTWENSWRRADWTAKNWDAAWVFVKWRDCNAAATVAFTHGLVSTTVSDHTFGGTTLLEPTKKDGTAPFVDDVISATGNNTGLMLRRAADGGVGSVSATVTMKLTNLQSTVGTNLDFRVYAIEMVFVPQSPYILGDGNGYSASSSAFAQTYNPGSPNIYPIAVTSEGFIPVYETGGYCANPQQGCLLTTTFQKGYNAFYMMKYEITQGQYADFLNATNQNTQTVHYSASTSNRYTITSTSGVYGANRKYRAMSQVSWADVSTFLAWAALRPLTEMEYEKVCRGTEPVITYQKAWGTPLGTTPVATSIVGTEDGTETVTAGININTNNITFSTGTPGIDNSGGPLRGGIYATASTTSRLQTGMGFYGAMDLSGNVAEYYVSVAAGVSGAVSANGVALGDGYINGTTTYAGHQIISSWPDALSPSNYIIRRGGSWSTNPGNTAANQETNVSFRASGSAIARDTYIGGRGGR